jgi:hypothetical protein
MATGKGLRLFYNPAYKAGNIALPLTESAANFSTVSPDITPLLHPRFYTNF